jgi:flagellar motor switch protein FliG
MEFLGPVRVRDVQKCQREIVDVIQGLRDEGVIVIGGGSGPDDYVS